MVKNELSPTGEQYHGSAGAQGSIDPSSVQMALGGWTNAEDGCGVVIVILVVGIVEVQFERFANGIDSSLYFCRSVIGVIAVVAGIANIE